MMKYLPLLFTSIVVCAAFIYGAVSVRYEVFPYPQLVQLKQMLSPSRSPVALYSDYYVQKKFLFDADKKTDYDVVFVGDSLTDDADWKVLLPNVSVANRGIQGDTALGVYHRLDSVYSTGVKKVFILIGTNDILRGKPADSIVAEYQTIIDALVEKKLSVYIQSCLFYGESQSPFNSIVAEVNQSLQAIARVSESVHYIDVNAHVASSSQRLKRYTYDDIHLTGEGYMMWKKALMPYFSNNN